MNFDELPFISVVCSCHFTLHFCVCELGPLLVGSDLLLGFTCLQIFFAGNRLFVPLACFLYRVADLSLIERQELFVSLGE